MHESWMWHSWGMDRGMLFMLLVGVLTIMGIVFLVQWMLDRTTTQQRRTCEDSAPDILNTRYARGEINKEGYEEQKKDLL